MRFGCLVTTAGDLLFGGVVTAFFESVRNQKTVGGKLNSYKLVKNISYLVFFFKAREHSQLKVLYDLVGTVLLGSWFLAPTNFIAGITYFSKQESTAN